MATTRLEDVIVPEVFNPYVVRETAERSILLQSGAVAESAALSGALAGGGSTFTEPFFHDLARLESNVSSDEESDKYTGGSNDSVPRKIRTGSEVQTRLSRNASWSSTDLAADLAGADPMGAIGGRVADYWAWDLQASFIATMKGVFADNAAAPTSDEHEQGDLTNDISGSAYAAGTTDIGSGPFLDALQTAGDAMGQLGLVMVHSIVATRLKKQNLIEFIPAAEGRVAFQSYLGHTLIVSDYMPAANGVFDTWIFGNAAVALGRGLPKVPTETKRYPDSGNGGGSEVLYNRTERIVHPVGHKYVGAVSNGGPSNAVLANGGSWERAFEERKQLRMARLVTREYDAA